MGFGLHTYDDILPESKSQTKQESIGTRKFYEFFEKRFEEGLLDKKYSFYLKVMTIVVVAAIIVASII